MQEIEDLAGLDAVLASPGPLTGLRFQDLDLTGHEAPLLARTDLEGLVVLGGRVSADLAQHLRQHGALVFPTDPGVPINPYRATLYQPHELYTGLSEHGYDATPDALAYHWSRDGDSHHDAFVTLLRAIHDDSMSDALSEVIGSSASSGSWVGTRSNGERRATPGPPTSAMPWARTGASRPRGADRARWRLRNSARTRHPRGRSTRR